jgi:hypothetical protein
MVESSELGQGQSDEGQHEEVTFNMVKPRGRSATEKSCCCFDSMDIRSLIHCPAYAGQAWVEAQQRMCFR